MKEYQIRKKKNLKLQLFQFVTSTDERGTSATSWATAPAPPNRLMLKTCVKMSMESDMY